MPVPSARDLLAAMPPYDYERYVVQDTTSMLNNSIKLDLAQRGFNWRHRFTLHLAVEVDVREYTARFCLELRDIMTNEKKFTLTATSTDELLSDTNMTMLYIFLRCA